MPDLILPPGSSGGENPAEESGQPLNGVHQVCKRGGRMQNISTNQAPATKKVKRKSISYDKYGYLFVAPFVIVFLVFQLYPIFFMKQFFETLPTELADAAKIDGCSEFGIFSKVYLPLIKPAALTLGIMTFQAGWNSFMWPMIVLNSQEMMTIQVGLSAFQYNYSTDYGPLMAGTVIATLPTLLLFISVQKYYVDGIAFSGGK